jgi:hypothetical protein
MNLRKHHENNEVDIQPIDEVLLALKNIDDLEKEITESRDRIKEIMNNVEIFVGDVFSIRSDRSGINLALVTMLQDGAFKLCFFNNDNVWIEFWDKTYLVSRIISKENSIDLTSIINKITTKEIK